MSRLAPAAHPVEQLQLARALGLKPLRLRSRPLPAVPARLRIASAEPLEVLQQDRLLQALLSCVGVAMDEVGPPNAGSGPLLTIGREHAESPAEAEAAVPGLAQLRADPAAKRALWPALRHLRRRLLNP